MQFSILQYSVAVVGVDVVVVGAGVVVVVVDVVVYIPSTYLRYYIILFLFIYVM